jgi:glycosyltransferase involved in cell wall biosynthesis
MLAAAHEQGVSVLIPARNEASGIAISLEYLLKSDHPNFEILILDDHSDDGTADIVSEFARKDNRVRLLRSKPLPEGWNGKQHACWQLAQLANQRWLLFLDADVHVSPDAISRNHGSNVGSSGKPIEWFSAAGDGDDQREAIDPDDAHCVIGLFADRTHASN